MDNGFPILGKFPSIRHHTFDSPLFVIVNIFTDDYSDDQAFRQLESLLDDASNQLPVLVTQSSHILGEKNIFWASPCFRNIASCIGFEILGYFITWGEKLWLKSTQGWQTWCEEGTLFYSKQSLSFEHKFSPHNHSEGVSLVRLHTAPHDQTAWRENYSL